MLDRNRRHYTERWKQGLLEGFEAFVSATITVYSTGIPGYDENNNPVVTKNVIYTGEARVQPLRTPSQRKTTGDQLYVQQVQFQIVNAAEINVIPDKHKVEVTKCLLNGRLIGPVFEVREVVDSSHPFEQTFITEVSLQRGP